MFNFNKRKFIQMFGIPQDKFVSFLKEMETQQNILIIIMIMALKQCKLYIILRSLILQHNQFWLLLSHLFSSYWKLKQKYYSKKQMHMKLITEYFGYQKS
ncbi:unnamed protein product [Paramecium sonneborni]|uniref:Transmembrane protein n=1 Tax=Paramecium sonneborni TaxID=65129 RepID=A0A8S1M1E0_9CILI|nr:unnamed protein product [Paramecium sonneborni]